MISKSPYESQQFFYLKTEKEVKDAVQTACELLHKSISNEEEHYILPLMVDSPTHNYFTETYDILENRYNVLHNTENTEDVGIPTKSYKNYFYRKEPSVNEKNINFFVRGNLSIFLPEFMNNLPETNKTEFFLQKISNNKTLNLNEDFYLNHSLTDLYFNLRRLYPDTFLEKTDLTDFLKDKTFNTNKVKLNILVNVRTEKINFYEDISRFFVYASIIPFFTDYYKSYLDNLKNSTDAPIQNKMFKTLVKSMETNLSGALTAFTTNNNSTEVDKKINFFTRMQQVINESNTLDYNTTLYDKLRKALKAANFNKEIILTTVSFIPVIKDMFEPKQVFISKKINFYSWDLLPYTCFENYLASSRRDILRRQTLQYYNNSILKKRSFDRSTVERLQNCFYNLNGYNDIFTLGLPLKIDNNNNWIYRIIKGNVFTKDTAHITKNIELTVFKDLTDFNSFINKLYSTGVNNLSLWLNEKQTPIQIPEKLSKIENRLNLHYLMSSDIHSFFDKIIEKKYKTDTFSLAMFIIYKRNSLPLKLFSNIMENITNRKENYDALLIELSKDKELLTWAVGKKIPSLLYLSIKELYNYLENIEPKKKILREEEIEEYIEEDI